MEQAFKNHVAGCFRCLKGDPCRLCPVGLSLLELAVDVKVREAKVARQRVLSARGEE